MKTTMIALAVAASLSAPAFAADPVPAAASSAAATTAEVPAAAKDKKYCLTEQLTGSRMPTKVCRTKAEWAYEGVSVSGKQD